MLLAVLENL